MYNPITAATIANAPPLQGLDMTRLPQKLTETYARIVSARISLEENLEGANAEDILNEIQRLGHTYLATVTLLSDPELRKSAAFVAGSAFALLTAHRGNLPEDNFTSTTICPACGAGLLFIIADAPSDAAEIVRNLRVDERDESIQGCLRWNLRCLALGDVASVADTQSAGSAFAAESSTDRAVAVLYNQCLSGVRELCRALVGGGDFAVAMTTFLQTKELCIDECTDLLDQHLQDGAPFFSTFPGPFLLASLLAAVSSYASEHSLIGIDTPEGPDAAMWQAEIKRLAHDKPFLWQNHKRVVGETRFLDSGVSAVLGLPTGAGKTTLAQLKAMGILVEGKKIVFLAPTHALVGQTTDDWKRTFPNAQVANSLLFMGEYAEVENETLPDVAVMTPERCLSLLSFSPDVFSDVGLVILDECHILHAQSLDESYRAIDAMVCLLRLLEKSADADFLLMSAMIENTDDIAEWLSEQTGRECIASKDAWKPTRQTRSCVVYTHRDVQGLNERLSEDREEARRSHRGNPGVVVKRQLYARPYGFFCLNQTWNTTEMDDYVVLPLSDEPVLLGANNQWRLIPNKNTVAASLAAKLANADIRTIVFCHQIKHTESLAAKVRENVGVNLEMVRSERDENLLTRLAEEMGSMEHVYDPTGGIAACHHGLLLRDERELTERLFRQHGGIKVLVATATLAQGMNLPAEAVVIAGDERFDVATNEQRGIEAHELLNAAGRAGRAGQCAQGLVFVVPGRVVELNDEDNTLGSRWFALKERVFSKSDQCLSIVDPIEKLVDAVQAEGFETGQAANYILRRVFYDAYEETEQRIRQTMMRTLAAFMARRREELRSFEHAVSSIVQLSQDAVPDMSTENPWLVSMAGEFGLQTDILRDVDERLDEIDSRWSVVDYIRWSLNNGLLFKMFRPQTLDDILGQLTTRAEREGESDAHELAFSRMVGLLERWVLGDPLNSIERLSGTPQDRLKKCLRARRLAIRWAADAAYALGVVARLYRQRCENDGETRMPITLATLASCVKYGIDMPVKLAIFYVKHFDIARSQAHRLCHEISPYLVEGEVHETFRETRIRVLQALQDADLLGPPAS